MSPLRAAASLASLALVAACASEPGSSSGGGATSTAQGSGGGEGGGDAAQIVIADLAARLANTYACDGMPDCADYRFTVVLRDDGDRAIAQLDRVRFTLDALTVDTGTAPICAAAPWTLAPGASSPVATLVFSYASASLLVPCDGDFATVGELGGALPPAPSSGQATLRLEGRLDDATPWQAEATADLIPGTN